WRFRATLDGPGGAPARRAGADRPQSGAGAAHPTADAGGGSLRSDTPAPPARGARANRSGPATASGGSGGRSRAGGYITAGAVAFTNRAAELWDSTGLHD